MDVNAAVAAAAALVGLCTGVVAMLAFRISERERTRPLRTAPPADQGLPAGVDTVLSVLRSSAVVLDEADGVVKASSAAYALGLVRGGRLAVEPMLQMARETRRDGEIRQQELDLPPRGRGRTDVLAVSARSAPLGSRLVLLLVEDLTEARRIEAVRRDFVANVSHELKTPAGALSLLSEAVLDAADDPEAVTRFAGRMGIEATRLTSLVQELIDLSRVQDNDPLTNAELVSVDELVSEAIDRCRQPATSKHITMAAGGTAGLHVWGNRGQLAAALGNLVENAVNYSPPDTRVAIAVSQVPADGPGGGKEILGGHTVSLSNGSCVLFLASGCGDTNGLRPAKSDIPASRLYSAVALILSFAGVADSRGRIARKRGGGGKGCGGSSWVISSVRFGCTGWCPRRRVPCQVHLVCGAMGTHFSRRTDGGQHPTCPSVL
jgi:two-component system, OmpR family, sensor histidine kinase SenX3